jgi:succinate dehydrogenase/fumarate reductase flavoprotein subunit
MNELSTAHADVLVIGGGLAGLRAAYEAAARGAKVLVASKGRSASPEIMGVNVPVGPKDSTRSYYTDLMDSGRWINNSELAMQLAEKSDDIVGDLEKQGVAWSKNSDGSFNTMLALGCSFPRLIHSSSHTGATPCRLIERPAAG